MISRFVIRLRLISKRWRQGVITPLLAIMLLLTGCVDSQVGIQFNSPQQGEIIQRLQLTDSLNNQSSRQWLDFIQRQSRALGGRVERSQQELTIKIPFTNGAELEKKFNQLLSRSLTNSEQLATPLPPIESHFSLRQNNLLFLERSRLHYDVDLRSLGIQSSSGTVLFSPTRLLNLEFSVMTPWGARSVKGSLVPEKLQGDRHLTWVLVPGQENQIDAVFWMPNLLGIGTLVIVLFVLAGVFLKAQLQPSRSESALPS